MRIITRMLRVRFSLRTLLAAALLAGSALVLHWRAAREPWAYQQSIAGLPVGLSTDAHHVLTEQTEESTAYKYITTVRIYDTQSFQETAQLTVPGAAVGFRSDSAVAILQGEGLFDWNFVTGTKTLRMAYPRACDFIFGRISPHCRAALFDEYQQVNDALKITPCLMDLQSGTVRELTKKTNMEDVSFSSDDSRCAFGDGDRQVEVRDVQTGKALYTFTPATQPEVAQVGCFQIGMDYVRATAFAHGERLLVVGHDEGSMRIWDLASRRELKTRKIGDRIFQVGSLELNSRVFAVNRSEAGDRIEIMDGESLEHIATLALHPDDTFAVCQQLLPVDENTLLMGCADNHARVWRRRRPEYWWGVAWLPEFWLTVLFAGALGWSVWRDRKRIGNPV